MIYARFLWRTHRGFLLFALAVVALFQFLIVRIVTTFDAAPLVSGMLHQLPEGIRKMFGEDAFSLLSVESAAAFGFNHPLVLVILAITAIMVPSRHIAGEAESGTLELLLAHPVTRTRLFFNLFLSAGAFLFVIILFALCVSMLSIGMFHTLTPSTALSLAGITCNLWLLYVLVASLTLAVSSFGKEGGKVVVRVAGLLLVFYLMHYLSSLWDELRFTQPFNVFNYYQPTRIMSGDRSLLLNVSVLTCLILTCLSVGVVQINRRDIPG